MSYDFVHYFEPSVINAKFDYTRSHLIEELKTQGILNPDITILWNYFYEKVNANWHKYGMLQFGLQKIGNLNDNCIDPVFLKLRSQHHLAKCLVASYDYCDFKEKWYGQDLVLDNMCVDCFKSVNSSESKTRCARCYRAYLNTWRPI